MGKAAWRLSRNGSSENRRKACGNEIQRSAKKAWQESEYAINNGMAKWQYVTMKYVIMAKGVNGVKIA